MTQQPNDQLGQVEYSPDYLGSIPSRPTTPPTKKMVWTPGWPKESGNYWFYGTYPGAYPERTIVTKLVRVHGPTMSGGLMYVVEGYGFMFKAEGWKGLWTPASIPTPPKEETAQKEKHDK